MSPTTLHVPQWLQPASGDPDITVTGLELRNYNRSLLGVADGFGGARGVLGGTNGALGFNVVQRGAGANFSVDVPSGRAVILDADVTNGGSALCWNDATFNLVTPTAPGTGTSLHRVVLQLRDKLENGTYTTYDFIPVLVPDATPGDNTLPAEPASSITLATVSIAAGQASVLNANIADYRETFGPVMCYKAADTGRTATSMTKDPDLQLNNLAAGATYEFHGLIIYAGGAGSGPGVGSEGDIKTTFNTSGSSAQYTVQRQNESGQDVGSVLWTDASTVTAKTTGVSNLLGLSYQGVITTTTSPSFLRFSWAKDSAPDSTNTTVKAGSYLRARRLF